MNKVCLQDIEGAIADFKAVIDQKQNSQKQYKGDRLSYFVAQALSHRGELYKQKGNKEAALLDWSAAIDCCATYSQPYYHRALLRIETGELDSALHALNSTIEIDPSIATAYLHRGNLRHRLGDLSGAMVDWQYAICNDFTLESAKQALEKLQLDTYYDQLSAVLSGSLSQKGLSVKVQHQKGRTKDDSLDIYIQREAGSLIRIFTSATDNCDA